MELRIEMKIIETNIELFLKEILTGKKEKISLQYNSSDFEGRSLSIPEMLKDKIDEVNMTNKGVEFIFLPWTYWAELTDNLGSRTQYRLIQVDSNPSQSAKAVCFYQNVNVVPYFE